MPSPDKFVKNEYNCNRNILIPEVKDQTNEVSGYNTKHVWSNVTGYGNIRMSNNSRLQKWNRIPPLSFPSSTLVNTKNAWNLKEKVQDKNIDKKEVKVEKVE